MKIEPKDTTAKPLTIAVQIKKLYEWIKYFEDIRRANDPDSQFVKISSRILPHLRNQVTLLKVIQAKPTAGMIDNVLSAGKLTSAVIDLMGQTAKLKAENVSLLREYKHYKRLSESQDIKLNELKDKIYSLTNEGESDDTDTQESAAEEARCK